MNVHQPQKRYFQTYDITEKLQSSSRQSNRESKAHTEPDWLWGTLHEAFHPSKTPKSDIHLATPKNYAFGGSSRIMICALLLRTWTYFQEFRF
jgi:hypothetical protein